MFPDGNVVTYNYDANGNMLGLTPPGKPTHYFSYDRDNRPVSYLPPIINGDTTATKYIYDQEGRLSKTIYPDSTFIEVVYDTVDGKQRAIVTNHGTTTFTYDSVSGNLKQIVGVYGDTLLYAYDGSLLLSEETRGLVNGKISVSYDNNFRVITETINNVDNVNISYDRDDNLMRVGAYAVKRNTLNGLVLSDTVGTVITDYGYNTVEELTSAIAKRSGSTIYSRVYTRDSLGRISALNETLQGVLKRYAYRYDNAGRLAEVKRNDTLISVYSYDGNGNRIAVTREAVTDSGYYDAQDRLLTYGQNQYSYTKSRYLRTKYTGTDSTLYSYDIQGSLLSVKLVDGMLIEYLIDAKNRRVGKKVNGHIVQRLLYSGDLKPIAEVDTVGQIVTRFVYAKYENVPEYMVRNGETYRFVLDNLGSVHLVINVTTGEIIQRIEYDEYGRALYDSNPGFQPFGFAGGLYDEHTKLVRFGVRDYDASISRWTSKDPILFAGFGSNLFDYSLSEPVNNIDRDGKVTAGAGAIVGALYGLGSTMFSTIFLGQNNTWQDYVSNTVAGAVAGAYSASGGLWGTSALYSAVSIGLNKILHKENPTWNDLSQFAESTLAGVIGGKIAGNVFPRGSGKEPTSLSSSLFGTIGVNTLWKQGFTSNLIEVLEDYLMSILKSNKCNR